MKQSPTHLPEHHKGCTHPSPHSCLQTWRRRGPEGWWPPGGGGAWLPVYRGIDNDKSTWGAGLQSVGAPLCWGREPEMKLPSAPPSGGPPCCWVSGSGAKNEWGGHRPTQPPFTPISPNKNISRNRVCGQLSLPSHASWPRSPAAQPRLGRTLSGQAWVPATASMGITGLNVDFRGHRKPQV